MEIRNHQGEPAGIALEGAKRRRAIGGTDNFVIACTEILREELTDISLVLDDQHCPPFLPQRHAFSSFDSILLEALP